MSHRLSSGPTLLATSSGATRRTSCYSLGARVALGRGLYAPGCNPWPGRHGGSDGRVRKALCLSELSVQLRDARTQSPAHGEPLLPPAAGPPGVQATARLGPPGSPACGPDPLAAGPHPSDSPPPRTQRKPKSTALTPCTLPSALPSNPAPAPSSPSLPPRDAKPGLRPRPRVAMVMRDPGDAPEGAGWRARALVQERRRGAPGCHGVAGLEKRRVGWSRRGEGALPGSRKRAGSAGARVLPRPSQTTLGLGGVRKAPCSPAAGSERPAGPSEFRG